MTVQPGGQLSLSKFDPELGLAQPSPAMICWFYKPSLHRLPEAVRCERSDISVTTVQSDSNVPKHSMRRCA